MHGRSIRSPTPGAGSSYLAGLPAGLAGLLESLSVPADPSLISAALSAALGSNVGGLLGADGNLTGVLASVLSAAASGIKQELGTGAMGPDLSSPPSLMDPCQVQGPSRLGGAYEELRGAEDGWPTGADGGEPPRDLPAGDAALGSPPFERCEADTSCPRPESGGPSGGTDQATAGPLSGGPQVDPAPVHWGGGSGGVEAGSGVPNLLLGAPVDPQASAQHMQTLAAALLAALALQEQQRQQQQQQEQLAAHVVQILQQLGAAGTLISPGSVGCGGGGPPLGPEGSLLTGNLAPTSPLVLSTDVFSSAAAAGGSPADGSAAASQAPIEGSPGADGSPGGCLGGISAALAGQLGGVDGAAEGAPPEAPLIKQEALGASLSPGPNISSLDSLQLIRALSDVLKVGVCVLLAGVDGCFLVESDGPRYWAKAPKQLKQT